MRRENLEPGKLAEALANYLDCPCRYFESAADEEPLMEAYRDARRRGAEEGFTPVIVAADEILLECLIMNSDRDSEDEGDYAFQRDEVKKYREKMLNTPLKAGEEVTELLIRDHEEMFEENELEWNDEMLGEMTGGMAVDSFSGYWSYGSNKTTPLILAEIPTGNPWEVFAWLPFGGWNECPDTPMLMAVAEDWFEKYGAVPAVMTHDVLEFDLPHPVNRADAMRLALEQYALCPDIVDQGPEGCTVGMLADTLAQSVVWYFWWD